MKKRVLVISHDKVGPKMAGPGIRYHQIASELTKHFDVTLATFNPSYTEGLSNVAYAFTDIKTYDFQAIFSKFEVIFALWLSAEMIAYAKSKGIVLIFDLYAPVPVEDLIGRVFAKRIDKASDYEYVVSLKNYQDFFSCGDYFVCSNPIQKDYWTGFAFASGSALPSTYTDFPIYDRIGLLPMGIDPVELSQQRDLPDSLRKDFPVIKKEDFVIVWTGGIWDWFDAETPIRAIKLLHDKGRTDIKLVFLGTKHPNDDVPAMSETTHAYSLAQKLDLHDSGVFFREGWIEYSSRLSYLVYADVALYAHKPSVEARYSHRTRVLDHFLTGLPTISTRGDYLGDTAAAENMGLAVPPLSVQEMASAILRLHDDHRLLQSIKDSIAKAQSRFTWEQSMVDMVAFIKAATTTRQIAPPPQITLNNNHLRRVANKVLPKRIKNAIKKRLIH